MDSLNSSAKRGRDGEDKTSSLGGGPPGQDKTSPVGGGPPERVAPEVEAGTETVTVTAEEPPKRRKPGRPRGAKDQQKRCERGSGGMKEVRRRRRQEKAEKAEQEATIRRAAMAEAANPQYQQWQGYGHPQLQHAHPQLQHAQAQVQHAQPQLQIAYPHGSSHGVVQHFDPYAATPSYTPHPYNTPLTGRHASEFPSYDPSAGCSYASTPGYIYSAPSTGYHTPALTVPQGVLELPVATTQPYSGAVQMQVYQPQSAATMAPSTPYTYPTLPQAATIPQNPGQIHQVYGYEGTVVPPRIAPPPALPVDPHSFQVAYATSSAPSQLEEFAEKQVAQTDEEGWKQYINTPRVEDTVPLPPVESEAPVENNAAEVNAATDNLTQTDEEGWEQYINLPPPEDTVPLPLAESEAPIKTVVEDNTVTDNLTGEVADSSQQPGLPSVKVSSPTPELELTNEEFEALLALIPVYVGTTKLDHSSEPASTPAPAPAPSVGVTQPATAKVTSQPIGVTQPATVKAVFQPIGVTQPRVPISAPVPTPEPSQAPELPRPSLNPESENSPAAPASRTPMSAPKVPPLPVVTQGYPITSRSETRIADPPPRSASSHHGSSLPLQSPHLTTIPEGTSADFVSELQPQSAFVMGDAPEPGMWLAQKQLDAKGVPFTTARLNDQPPIPTIPRPEPYQQTQLTPSQGVATGAAPEPGMWLAQKQLDAKGVPFTTVRLNDVPPINPTPRSEQFKQTQLDTSKGKGRDTSYMVPPDPGMWLNNDEFNTASTPQADDPGPSTPGEGDDAWFKEAGQTLGYDFFPKIPESELPRSPVRPVPSKAELDGMIKTLEPVDMPDDGDEDPRRANLRKLNHSIQVAASRTKDPVSALTDRHEAFTGEGQAVVRDLLGWEREFNQDVCDSTFEGVVKQCEDKEGGVDYKSFYGLGALM